MHPLDRPVWASLTTLLASLSEGSELAKRFDRAVNLFASARDDSPEALAALAKLVQPGERVYVLQVPEITVPPGLVALKRAQGVQMVASRQIEAEAAAANVPIQHLTDSDAPDMLALAQLTESPALSWRAHTPWAPS
jgi:hypothetical protein